MQEVRLLVIIGLLPGHFRVSMLLGIFKCILQLTQFFADEQPTSNNVESSLLNYKLCFCIPVSFQVDVHAGSSSLLPRSPTNRRKFCYNFHRPHFLLDDRVWYESWSYNTSYTVLLSNVIQNWDLGLTASVSSHQTVGLLYPTIPWPLMLLFGPLL